MTIINKTQKMVMGALFIALGVVIPQAFHMIPNAGMILLPMHIPVLLCGFLCGWQYGAIVGFITPIISSLLTGMPSAVILPGMILELATYGTVSGLIFSKLNKKNLTKDVYLSLICAMILGRLVSGTANAFLLRIGNYSLQMWISSAFIMAIPGIVIQLLLIPVLLVNLTKASKIKTNSKISNSDELAIDQAKKLIALDGTSCVVIRDNKIIFRTDGRGISPIMKLLENNPELLKDSFIVDRIIGKAAAMLLVLGGARGAYGDTVSKSAEKYTENKNFKLEYNRCIDVLSNREGNGICPMEKTVMDIDDAQVGYEELKKTMFRLKNVI